MQWIYETNHHCQWCLQCSLSIALSVSLFSLLFSMCLCVVFWYLNKSIYPSNLSGYVFVILLYSACLNSFWCFGRSHILHQFLLLISKKQLNLTPYWTIKANTDMFESLKYCEKACKSLYETQKAKHFITLLCINS